jgi:hypothetical protein
MSADSVSNTVTVQVGTGAPAAPTSFTAAAVPIGTRARVTLNWAGPWTTNPTSFTIERASNAAFTRNRSVATVAGDLRASTQLVNRNTNYYYRIRANDTSGSSAWLNAQPFPILTP